VFTSTEATTSFS